MTENERNGTKRRPIIEEHPVQILVCEGNWAEFGGKDLWNKLVFSQEFEESRIMRFVIEK